ncbi:SDR family oxidoreductase [Croceicoccus ponticola]|uniref:SDR family oxidoreductase n=1 Tax=Croceicoccus ponticola TaxID=2217664 RepID=A0A437GVX0_9SPHN|nr:SDR family oxidoreductase [Croceicoccus ponticola]RVQ66050.1 SDR family oxidoreductase [Croceicoccus ponticola]
MKIVIIGGTGLIGSKTVAELNARGHEAIAAAPSTGVDTITGDGLDTALEGASIVIDLANSPSFEDATAMEFFQVSGRNLLAAASKAGVHHHIALSVVGTEKLQASGYFRAKQAQEELIKASGTPYTIIHSTQFFEFMGAIANGATEGGTVRLSSALIQPIISDDVAIAVADIALAEPANAVVEIAGPERQPISVMVARFLTAAGDPRVVVSDDTAAYFGVVLDELSLIPAGPALIAPTAFQTFLDRGELRT